MKKPAPGADITDAELVHELAKRWASAPKERQGAIIFGISLVIAPNALAAAAAYAFEADGQAEVGAKMLHLARGGS